MCEGVSTPYQHHTSHMPYHAALHVLHYRLTGLRSKPITLSCFTMRATDAFYCGHQIACLCCRRCQQPAGMCVWIPHALEAHNVLWRSCTSVSQQEAP